MAVAWGMPGVRALRSTTESVLIWGGDDNKVGLISVQAQMESLIADADNTPTTDIREGLLLGAQTTGGQHIQWDLTATDGSEQLRGVLAFGFSTLDEDASAEDHFMPMIVRAPLKAANLRILGAAFVGHAYEYVARRVLHSMGCILDDDIGGYSAGAGYRVVNQASSYTVVTGDNGTIFTTRGAGGAVVFTLPTIVRGLEFTFINEAGQDMTVTGAANIMVAFNNLTATSVAFSTASELIAGGVKITTNDDGSKWLSRVMLQDEAGTHVVA